jgi:hypothetical protein
MRLADVNKLFEIGKKPAELMAFQMNASATSKATIGTPDPFIQALPSAVTFSKSLEGNKIITLPKHGKDPKFPQNLGPTSFLSTTGKLFEKVIMKLFQKHIEERGLLNASQFGFRARYSKTL